MPIYEYHCESCQSEFEALVRQSEQPECPKCGGQQLAKQFSVPSAHSSSGSLPISSPSAGGGCGAPHCGQITPGGG